MKKTLLATTIAISIAASAAQAASIDFQAIASAGEYGSPFIPLVADNGVVVGVSGATITGSDPTPTGLAYAYLDKGAGLGVCSAGLSLSLQCTDSADDNVTPAEMLTVTFGTEINLTSMDFLNAGHRTRWDEGSHAHLSVDGGAEQQINLAGTVAMNYTGTEFEFYLHEGQDPSNQFYIRTMDFDTVGTVSAVPLPAAVWLFGAGLVGLVGVARRKV